MSTSTSTAGGRGGSSRLRRVFLAAGWLALLGCGGSGGERIPLMALEDEVRAGRASAEIVSAELGLLDDEALDRYLDTIGQRLLAARRQPLFEYSFQVVNEVEPNAFVFPGGFIYVTRGLLALGNDEDELACVLAHEIVHAERRHVARNQLALGASSPLLGAWNRSIQPASYSQEMEREADELGQRLCAAAGYDPIGLAHFLQRLRQAERIRFGFSRQPGFLETHPGLQERAAVNSARAGKLGWKRDPRIGDPRKTFLEQVDGLDVGERPESGVFAGSRFLHPLLGFQITFPRGWELSLNNRVVGARSPDTGAIVFVAMDQEDGDPQARGEEWLASLSPGEMNVDRAQAVSVGRLPAWRYELSSVSRRGRVIGTATFVALGDRTFRLMAVAPTRGARAELGRARTAARSFRRLSPENRALVRAHRLRVVKAEPDESIADLGRRVGDTWVPTHRAIVNGLFSHHVFAGGERVKVALAEPFEVEVTPAP